MSNLKYPQACQVLSTGLGGAELTTSYNMVLGMNFIGAGSGVGGLSLHSMQAIKL